MHDLEKIKEIGFLFHAEHFKKTDINEEGFLYPLSWVLKQIRDILIMEI